MQLKLPMEHRSRQPDRNAAQGGRSFYFFDFDDNVLNLQTPIYVRHRKTGEEEALTTREFSEVAPLIGNPGPWEHFDVDYDDRTGSFRRFRDHARTAAEGEQPFVEDMHRALQHPSHTWQGPSWDFFDYAVYNRRPLSVITARGHHPSTLRRGIACLVDAGFLAHQPNYLSVYPVSHLPTRAQLGLGRGAPDIPQLKKLAIISSVEEAMQIYGPNPYHRFGMSDDDPANVALIIQAMRELKARHTHNAFFVIDTSGNPVVKTEVFLDHLETETASEAEQLSLFE